MQIIQSDEISSIAKALALAQGKFKPVVRDKTVSIYSKKTGTSYTFKYAPLENIRDAVAEALAEAGIAWIGGLVKVGDRNYFENRLIDASGQYLGNLVPVVTEDADGGPKAIGSAITYARRYGAATLLGIVADDDDDGSAAQGDEIGGAKKPRVVQKGQPAADQVERISAEQVLEINTLLVDGGVTIPKFISWARGMTSVPMTKLEDLPAALYEEAKRRAEMRTTRKVAGGES